MQTGVYLWDTLQALRGRQLLNSTLRAPGGRIQEAGGALEDLRWKMKWTKAILRPATTLAWAAIPQRELCSAEGASC